MREVRPAPYPADTRAKGWRFELDYEQIEQSGTWAAAMTAALDGLPLARPFLLAMWYAAWKQVPCGSLPTDDRELAGAIGIPSAVFAEYRDVLLRGWWLAEDGRLYHDTLTTRVIEMMGKRRSDSDRQAAKRAKDAASHAYVTRDTDGSHANVRCESSTDHRPPNTSSPPTGEKKPPRKRDAGPSCPEDVDTQVWSDWLELRRKKRAPVTTTVLDGARSEAGKAGLTFEDFLRVWCRRGTQGLEADWLRPNERAGPVRSITSTDRKSRQLETAALMTGATRQPENEIIDVTPRLVAS
jgi:hypothetical protein